MMGGEHLSVSVIIPALNEEAAIGAVVAAVPRNVAQEILVIDNDSTDGTARVAAEAGATVVPQPMRGYGAACLAGALAARGAVLVYIDGDGSFDPGQIPDVVAPILGDQADLVLGSRTLGENARSAMPVQQRLGNALAVALLRGLYGLRVTDLGPFRAIRRQLVLDLEMQEMTYGWPTEMMVKAARAGARIRELPVTYRPRLGGRSKVSGTFKGVILAGYHILKTVLKYASG
jgi:glycosyltransferase involved in cell wall biosynthesis